MRKISDAILAVTAVLFILSASVALTLAFRPLYYFDIGYLRIAETSGYPVEEIRANYDALIDYNLSPAKEELVFPTFPMSGQARIHFAEVKAIFQFFLKLLAATAVLLAAGIFWKRARREYGYLAAAGLIAPALVLCAGGLIAAGWERAFICFHELVFQNEYWLFDPETDPVIMILPDTFFLHCAGMILALIMAGSAACLFAYARSRGRQQGKKR